MRYRPELAPALRNLYLDVRAGEHIGIVGRTGAGKSSIITALLRLVDLSQGSILLDKVDISNISLSDLRSRMTVVPQDPKLFRGTIRTNLDLFNEHSDPELVSAMQKVRLMDSKYHTGSQLQLKQLSLDSSVEEDGMNLSFGQRQLLTLARALLRSEYIHPSNLFFQS